MNDAQDISVTTAMMEPQAADSKLKISLIVPTYGREALLVETLKCALAQECENYEILVVDQTPQHDAATEKFLRENADTIHLLRLDKPSVTQARNAGILAAHGDILVFVDDDTSFAADFLTRHAQAYRCGVGAVQGRIMENKGGERSHPPRMNRWIKFTGGNNCPHEGLTNTVTGCNFSLSREAANKVGLFDIRYTGVAVREESDYAVRLVRAGYKVRFSPSACVTHHRADKGGHGQGDDVLFFDRLYYYNEFLFAKKHFPAWVVWLYRLRLKRRGKRALKRLIESAEKQTDREL